MNRMHWAVVGGLAAGLVAVLFAVWHFNIQDLERQRDEKLTEKQALEDKLQETKQRAAQYEKFQAEAENVRRDLEFYSRRLDDPLDKEQLYAEVTGIIQSLNLMTATFVVEEKTDPKMVKNEVTLNYNGDLDQTGQLLNKCVSQSNIVMPVSLELTRVDDVTGYYRESLVAKYIFDVLSGQKAAK
jgi:Tfp pilus assembly protein PilO